MAKKRLNSLSIFAIIIAVIGIGVAAFFVWISANAKAVSSDTDPVAFVIRKGESVDSIGQNLKQKGLIRSTAVFKYIVMKEGLATKIQAGSFKLNPAMSVTEIAQSLISGRQDIWVTVLEGWRREEIAESLEVAFKEAGASFDTQTFLQTTRGQEGMLFPDTYLFPLDANETTVASIMTNTLDRKITPQMQQDIDQQGKTLNQILTMASLIEREAKGSADRKMVSGILWKRIQNDWPLQVDATLQYVKGYDPVQKTWWKPPLAADKELKSPYNTYQNPGLPPNPICSPSLDSIQAAIYPTANEYWFYITDNQGQMRYAVTNDEHNQNVENYLR